MRKVNAGLAITVFILLLVGGVVLLKGVFQNQNPSTSPTSVPPSLTSTPQTQEVDLKASFQINTQGVVRSFKNPKYHLKTAEVYISADDPTVVHVTKIGVTWDDFFKTLPMKLTKDCLTTGDGETFCSGSGGTLRFYLNDKEDPDLLDRKIENGGKALIKF